MYGSEFDIISINNLGVLNIFQNKKIIISGYDDKEGWTYEKINFIDCPPLYCHMFDGSEEIEDNVEHDFIGLYYGHDRWYSFISDFIYGGQIVLGDPETFSEQQKQLIYLDYKYLCDKNNPKVIFDKEKIFEILDGIEQHRPIPVISNQDVLHPSAICFYTIVGIEEIPLLLLLAIYKNVFGFTNWEDCIDYFCSMFGWRHTIIWKDEDKTNFTAFMYTGTQAASLFSGYPVESFDDEDIGSNESGANDIYNLYSFINSEVARFNLDAFAKPDSDQQIGEELSSANSKNMPKSEDIVSSVVNDAEEERLSIERQIKQIEDDKKKLYGSRKSIGKYIASIAVSGAIGYILFQSIVLWLILGEPGVLMTILFFVGVVFCLAILFVSISKLKGTISHNRYVSTKIRKLNKEIEELKKKND